MQHTAHPPPRNIPPSSCISALMQVDGKQCNYCIWNKDKPSPNTQPRQLRWRQQQSAEIQVYSRDDDNKQWQRPWRHQPQTITTTNSQDGRDDANNNQPRTRSTVATTTTNNNMEEVELGVRIRSEYFIKVAKYPKQRNKKKQHRCEKSFEPAVT